MTFPLDIFLLEAMEAHHSPEYLDDIEDYIKNLDGRNLPVIFTLEHLCLSAKVNIIKFRNLCNSTRNDSYKRFKLRKKRGGFRIIRSPDPELKYLQRWILFNILDKIASHQNSKGFD